MAICAWRSLCLSLAPSWCCLKLLRKTWAPRPPPWWRLPWLPPAMLEAAAALAALVLFFLAGLFLLRAWEEKAGAGKGSAPGSADPGDALIYYNGAWYRPRKGLETVLAIGVDQAAVDDTLYRVGTYEQPDFLLLVIDKRNERCIAVHINRDAMTEIRALDDVTNEFLGTINRQLSLAHTYGNRPEARCWSSTRIWSPTALWRSSPIWRIPLKTAE